MKFGYFLLGVNLRHQAACAQRAEARGFESAWVPEHLVMPEELPATYPYTADGVPGITARTPLFDPWIVIAHLAAVTSTLRWVEPGSKDLDDLTAKLRIIHEHRKAAGREHLPFEVTVIANNLFNTPDAVRRAESLGVTRIVVSALDSPYVPLGQLKGQDYVDFVDKYADNVLCRL